MMQESYFFWECTTPSASCWVIYAPLWRATLRGLPHTLTSLDGLCMHSWDLQNSCTGSFPLILLSITALTFNLSLISQHGELYIVPTLLYIICMYKKSHDVILSPASPKTWEGVAIYQCGCQWLRGRKRVHVWDNFQAGHIATQSL